jgi:hypothetical protein
VKVGDLVRLKTHRSLKKEWLWRHSKLGIISHMHFKIEMGNTKHMARVIWCHDGLIWDNISIYKLEVVSESG